MREKNMKNSRDGLVRQLIEIARDAGAAAMTCRRASLGLALKDDASPVTRADLASHAVLVSRLTNLSPKYVVVSEEDPASHELARSSSKFWLIDPLDGTKEFVTRSAEFTVNIALIENGVTVLGVVHAPALKTCYWGGKGLGSFRSRNCEVTSISVSRSMEFSTLRLVASHNHLNQATQAFIERLAPIFSVQVGSSLKFCRIAEGDADIYPRLAPTYEWDTAAAQAVLEGAGGFVVDLNGKALSYGEGTVLNPPFIALGDLALMPRIRQVLDQKLSGDG